MKLKSEPRAGRGNRPVKGHELLRSPETGPDSLFPWFDAVEHEDVLARIQQGFPEQPVKVANSKDFYQAQLEFRYFLSTICDNHPELLRFTPVKLAEVAEKAFNRTVSGTLDAKGVLAGVYDPKAKQRMKRENPESLRRRLDMSGQMPKLDFIYCLKLVAPEQVRWVIRAVSTNPRDYIEDPSQAGIFVCEAAAKLMLLYPQKREELLRCITVQDATTFKDDLKQQERDALEHDPVLFHRMLWANMLFCQQILAAQSVEITPEGQIILKPPLKPVMVKTPLPARREV